MFRNKTTQKQSPQSDDSIELVGLDVQYVSGVGTPATGEQFLLYKSKDGKECPPEDEAAPEDEAEDEAESEGKPKKKKKEQAAWAPPVATSQSENGPEMKKADAPKKYTWAACMRDNAGEKDPAAVCATLARKVAGDKAMKSADLIGQDILLPVDADLVALVMEARKEASNMTEQVTKQDNPLQSFVRTMAQAVGLQIADEAMEQGVKHLEALATAKATGKAPSDDTGAGAPSYPANENKVPYPSNIKGQAPSDDKTNGGPLKSKAAKVFEGEVTQQPETIQGAIAPQTRSSADGADVVQGTPLYKSSDVEAFLARLEAQAPNKAAVAAAKDALAGVFEAPAPEATPEYMTRDGVEAIVLAGLQPVVEALEEMTKSLDAVRGELETAKTAKAADDPKLAEIANTVADLVEVVGGIEARLTNKSTETRLAVAKSRVPAAPARALRGESEDDAVWSGSAFEAAANLG